MNEATHTGNAISRLNPSPGISTALTTSLSAYYRRAKQSTSRESSRRNVHPHHMSATERSPIKQQKKNRNKETTKEMLALLEFFIGKRLRWSVKSRHDGPADHLRKKRNKKERKIKHEIEERPREKGAFYAAGGSWKVGSPQQRNNINTEFVLYDYGQEENIVSI